MDAVQTPVQKGFFEDDIFATVVSAVSFNCRTHSSRFKIIISPLFFKFSSRLRMSKTFSYFVKKMPM